ncbi:MAG: T9SS type A sorting domain-containing protein [Bacteroidia bacterium]|nr:T9SS type A sorting domain-containing protein [Bacteroidia bacterium]
MKTKKIYLVIALSIIGFVSKAQFYSQGDIAVTLQPSGSHDVNTCSSQGQMMYQITIQNSFMGDSVKVKDMSGMMIYEEMNTTGANPWNVMAPVYTAFGFAQDNQVVGGYVNFFGPPSKVISGTDTIYNIMNSYGIPVSNPCTYDNINGKIYVDYNSDCMFNGSDVPLSSIPVTASLALNSPSMSSTSASSYSDFSGNYSIQAQQTWMTSYSVSIPSYYQFIFPSTACSPAVYNFTTLPQANVDFSLQCSSNLDVQCGVFSAGVIRPNIPFILYPYVNNTGCNAASGVLKLVLDPNVTYSAALSSNPATTVSGDTLMWNYSNLSNLSNGMYWNSFFSGVHLTPTVAVNIGDILCFEVITNVPTGDVNSANNISTLCLGVVNSYDPNMKEVSPKGTGATGDIPTTTNELTYTVHFQNTGNAVAYNIYVIDTLDSDVEAASLQILGSTHTMVPQWIGANIVRFNFNNINLADSTSNEPLSHGAFSYKVNLNNALPVGTQIKNTAHIYFDSNPAIVTNTTLNTIAATTGISDKMDETNGLIVFPNPFSDVTTFTIRSYNAKELYSFELYDVLGKQVKVESNISSQQFNINRSSLENGMYFYKVYSTERQLATGKLIVK